VLDLKALFKRNLSRLGKTLAFQRFFMAGNNLFYSELKKLFTFEKKRQEWFD
jgi:hypothetical protein